MVVTHFAREKISWRRRSSGNIAHSTHWNTGAAIRRPPTTAEGWSASSRCGPPSKQQVKYSNAPRGFSLVVGNELPPTRLLLRSCGTNGTDRSVADGTSDDWIQKPPAIRFVLKKCLARKKIRRVRGSLITCRSEYLAAVDCEGIVEKQQSYDDWEPHETPARR